MFLHKELVRLQDRLFWVYQKVKKGHFKDEHIQDIKKYWDCDFVVEHQIQQNQSIYIYFLREIVDAEIVEEPVPLVTDK